MYITIDIGGTNIRVAASLTLDTKLIKDQIKFTLVHNFDQDFANLIRSIEIVAKDSEISSIGIGISGDVENDVVFSAQNLQEWEGQAFVRILTKQFNCSVFIANDGVSASLGEALYGTSSFKEFVYIAWGTGIGGAHVTKEIGSSKSNKIDWDHYFERWENMCGGASIIKKYGKTPDFLVKKEWDEIMDNFQSHIIAISKELNIKNLVIAGGATFKQLNRVHKMSNELKDKGINLNISSLGDDIGLYGGLALIKFNQNQH